MSATLDAGMRTTIVFHGRISGDNGVSARGRAVLPTPCGFAILGTDYALRGARPPFVLALEGRSAAERFGAGVVGEATVRAVLSIGMPASFASRRMIQRSHPVNVASPGSDRASRSAARRSQRALRAAASLGGRRAGPTATDET